MISLLVAGALLSPVFFEATPEIRSTYVSLGKIVEDRPMQVTTAYAGLDAGEFGRFAVYNYDVSSLSDRRGDVHRHALYHTEFGPAWQHSLEIADDWRIATDLKRAWTIYRGFDDPKSDATYHWWQIVQSLENPYVVPFYWLRRGIRSSNYLYFRAGLRRRFALPFDLYVTPSVFTEGGNSRNQLRVLGKRPGGGKWSEGVASVTFRLEFGWRISENVSAFLFAEQYDVVGDAQRSANGSSSYRCAHNDWTHGGGGIRIKF